MIMEIISILLGVILLETAEYGYAEGNFELHRLVYLIDMPSLIILLVFTAPVLFKGDVWKDFKRAWQCLRKDYVCHLSELRRALDVVEMIQKQVIYAGVICMLMSVIVILRNLSSLQYLGPNLAVAILTILYATIFEMLLLPLQLEVKRRIIDYMEIDMDAESEKAAAGKKSENATAGEEKESVTAGGETENITAVEKESENVTTEKEKEKAVIGIQIESGKDVTGKVDETAGKGTEEKEAGTEEGQI